jgi:NADPH:quinone reductase
MTATGHRAQLRRADRRSGRRWRSARAGRTAEHGTQRSLPFVLLYTVGWDRIIAAGEDISRAIEDSAFRVGEEAGLPLHRYSLEDAAAAHAAVEGGATGKVLITVATS